MLGNDVVDLADRDTLSGATHTRFDDRVFAAAERQAIARSACGERLRWRLWAAKESAFKAAKRVDPRTVFSPRRFEVLVVDDEVAAVIHGASRWTVRVRQSDEALHAIALASGTEIAEPVHGFVRVAPDETDLSRAVRRLALDRIATDLDVEVDRLAIGRHGRIPYVLLDGRPAPLELSLSHHGGVIGFAAALRTSGEAA